MTAPHAFDKVKKAEVGVVCQNYYRQKNVNPM